VPEEGSIKQIRVVSLSVLALLCANLFSQTQQNVATNTSHALIVPPLVNFSGILTDVKGKPMIECVFQ
jgi:hypothetical protein